VSWFESVQALPDLEMYLPVPSHRAWDGGSELVVLPFPESDEELQAKGGNLLGYVIGGGELELSTRTIPSRPVLVLVPVEDGDLFEEDGESSPTIPVPSLIPGDSTPGGWSCGPITAGHDKVYACRVDITNIGQYEPWPMGQPEITIAAGHLDVSTGVLYPGAGCNADNQPGARFYDQNNDTWWGHAFVTTNSALASGSTGNRKAVLWVWEDDAGDKCTFNPEGQGYSWMNATTAVGTSMFLAGIALTQPLMLSFGAVLLVPIAFALNADDAIGVVGVQPSGNPTINPKPILLKPGATLNVVGSMLFESFP